MKELLLQVHQNWSSSRFSRSNLITNISSNCEAVTNSCNNDITLAHVDTRDEFNPYDRMEQPVSSHHRSNSDDVCSNPTFPEIFVPSSATASLPNIDKNIEVSSQPFELPTQLESQFSCKRNGKSIFCDQYEENKFFLTFEGLIIDAMASRPISNREILMVARNSVHFSALWNNLILKFGEDRALKKLSDKIRTFARNNLQNFFTSS